MVIFTLLIACKSVRGYYIQIYSKQNTVITGYKHYFADLNIILLAVYYLYSASASIVLNLHYLSCVALTNTLLHICSLYRYV